tara:strand:+ start:486 stop:665 length:180 start_codon:yes stop_codon:yes gene_type:complete
MSWSALTVTMTAVVITMAATSIWVLSRHELGYPAAIKALLVVLALLLVVGQLVILSVAR